MWSFVGGSYILCNMKVGSDVLGWRDDDAGG